MIFFLNISIKKFLNSIIIFVVICYNTGYTQNNAFILENVFKKIDNINTQICTISSRERFGNEYKIEKGYYKISKKPLLIYYKQLVPTTGAEVIINSNIYPKAYVNPNKTLLPNIYLDPYGETLRDKRHHVIFDAGYEYVKKIILTIKHKYNYQWDNIISCFDYVKIGNERCIKICLKNVQYSIQKRLIEKTISIEKFARKENLSDYKILELNPAFSSIFDIIKEKTTILCPSDYAKEIILYVNEQNLLIVKIEVYDEKGLFEEYLFENIKINVTFDPKEYEPGYERYNF